MRVGSIYVGSMEDIYINLNATWLMSHGSNLTIT